MVYSFHFINHSLTKTFKRVDSFGELPLLSTTIISNTWPLESVVTPISCKVEKKAPTGKV